MRPSHASASNPLSRNPLAACAAAFCVGIFLDSGVQIHIMVLVSGLVIVLGSTLFETRLQTACVLAAFVCGGAFVSGLAESGKPGTSLSGLYDKGWINSADPVRVYGQMDDHPQLSVGGVFLSLDVSNIEYKRESIPTSGRVRLFLKTEPGASGKCFENLDLKAGNAVRIAVRLKRENTYLNPGTASTIEMLERRGVAAAATLKSCLLIEKTGANVSAFAFAYEFREFLVKRILETHERRTAGIVLASVLGNRNFLTKDDGETFRENGTFHVLVISGLHITLLGGLILLLVRRLTSKRYLQFFVSNGLLWSYAVLVGLQLPVLRASLMFSIILLGHTAYQKAAPLNSLGAACLVILVWRPSDLFNPSFQLTSLSILAIIGFAFPLIEKVRITGAWMPSRENPFPPEAARGLRIFAESLYWSEIRWSIYLSKQNWNGNIEKTGAGRFFADSRSQIWLRRLFELAAVSFSVQVFLLPLLVINFHRVGAASILSNLFAGSAVAAQDLLSLVTLVVSVINLESAQAFSRVSSKITEISLYLQSGIAQQVIRPLRVPVYTGVKSWVYPLYYIPAAGLLISAALWKPFGSREFARIRKWLAYSSFLSVAVLAGVIILHPFSSPEPDGRLRVDFLDVGQGDAALVTFPNGQTLLIDGGGQRDFEDAGEEKRDVSGIGERVVSEFLWEKGYSSVDYVLATHPDADHINGLSDVVNNFDVKEIFTGGSFAGVPGYDLLHETAAQKGVPISTLSEGMVLKIGEAEIAVFNPPRDRVANPDNDDSVVLRIRFQSRSILFTGDIGETIEQGLCDSKLPIESDVVKVAHHGSRTSSSTKFVRTTKPVYAIIPVGRKSPYGHPHKEVVDRWTGNGSRVILVGELGTVTVSTDGSDLKINRFLEN